MIEERIIRLCGLKFKKQCPLDWDSLAGNDDPGIRHCSECDRDVFLCTSDDETMEHAEQGHCIARPAPASGELSTMFVGEPDVEWLRANGPTAQQGEADRIRSREGVIDSALDNLRFTSRRCAACGYPVPTWWRECRVCGGTEVRDQSNPISS